MGTRTKVFLLIALSVSTLFSCVNKKHTRPIEKGIAPKTNNEYITLIISLDTLPFDQLKMAVFKEDSLLNITSDKNDNPLYHYFKGWTYGLQSKHDSAIFEYKRMIIDNANVDLNTLKEYTILEKNTTYGDVVTSDYMDSILSAVHYAEQSHSQFTYKMYDLLARAFFQNNNDKKALFYTELYLKAHPFKFHPVIQQRYYDILFLISAMTNDYKKMMLYNSKSQKLAEYIKDKLAIARTYDNQSHIYFIQKQYGKALFYSKKYFNYLEQMNSLNKIAFSNLADNLYFNKQVDSAIKYYNEGLTFIKQNLSGRPDPYFYKGLANAYKLKGDYIKGMIYTDSAYSLEIQDMKAMETVKVAELYEKYETAKKDQSIADLNARNQLNEQIIRHHKRTLLLIVLIFLGIVSFLLILFRQQKLNEKNRVLQSENVKLHMEQKLLQAQLNPHFIFNAIANLQSLIAEGDKKGSLLYLSHFSKLLRNILEQNRKDFIELEEEIQSLTNYIQLQQMRYVHLFQFRITVDGRVDSEEILIPPMLIQPFVENAIEHGFRNINWLGFLKISFIIESDYLQILIDDNGAGINIKKSKEKQSLASNIQKERLNALFISQGQKAYFDITDKRTQGGRGVIARIIIPIIKF